MTGEEEDMLSLSSHGFSSEEDMSPSTELHLTRDIFVTKKPSPSWVKYQSSKARDIWKALKQRHHRIRFPNLRRRRIHHRSSSNSDQSSFLSRPRSPPLLPSINTVLAAGVASSNIAYAMTSNPQLVHDDTEHNIQLVGHVFAWLCTALYLVSRLPQIYANYTRKSAAGLSFYMFLFAGLGNLTYVVSILIKSTEYTYLLNSLPYILGSSLTFDCDDLVNRVRI